jgi:hypothetical protein
MTPRSIRLILTRKKRTGATRVVPFSHLVRNNLVETATKAAKTADPKEIIPIMTPSLVCHVGKLSLISSTFPRLTYPKTNPMPALARSLTPTFHPKLKNCLAPAGQSSTSGAPLRPSSATRLPSATRAPARSLTCAPSLRSSHRRVQAALSLAVKALKFLMSRIMPRISGIMLVR